MGRSKTNTSRGKKKDITCFTKELTKETVETKENTKQSNH